MVQNKIALNKFPEFVEFFVFMNSNLADILPVIKLQKDEVLYYIS